MIKTLAVAAAALAIRLFLIFQYPIVFGGDSMLRLVNRDRILISYQLPFLQSLVWTVSRLSSTTLAVRLLMAAIGGLAAAAFYRFAANFVPERAALLAALLLATNPFITPVSIVPYQEILLAACLLLSLHYFFNGRDVPASILLGLACLTRFEAWVACPILAFVAWRRGRPLWQSALLYGWAPLAWLAFRRGLSEPGTFVLDKAFSFSRLYRLPVLAGHTIVNATIPTLLLAAIGVWVIVRERRDRDPRLRLLAALLVLFAIAILFSAHGEPPDTNRYVTTREIHIPLLLVTLLAAIGCTRFPRLAIPVAAAGVVLGAIGSRHFVEHETARPEIRLGYDLARYLDARVHPGETVVILARPIAYDLYLRRLRETGGEAALASAHKVLAEIDTSPLDFQRTMIHSHLKRSQLRASPDGSAQWVAVWSDYAGTDPSAAAVRSHPDAVLTAGERSVCVRRVR
jgi:hypothetical protein